MRGLFVFLPAEHKGAAERMHETFVSKRMHSMFYSSASVHDLLPSSTTYLPALSPLYVVWHEINPFKKGKSLVCRSFLFYKMTANGIHITIVYWMESWLNTLENKSWTGKSWNIYALRALQAFTQAKVLFSLLFLSGIKQNQCSLICQKTDIKQHRLKTQMDLQIKTYYCVRGQRLEFVFFVISKLQTQQNKIPQRLCLDTAPKKKTLSDSVQEVK